MVNLLRVPKSQTCWLAPSDSSSSAINYLIILSKLSSPFKSPFLEAADLHQEQLVLLIYSRKTDIFPFHICILEVSIRTYSVDNTNKYFRDFQGHISHLVWFFPNLSIRKLHDSFIRRPLHFISNDQV